MVARHAAFAAVLAIAFGSGCASTTPAGGEAAESPAGSRSAAPSSGNRVRVGQMLPDLTVEPLSGQPIKVSSYRGKVLLLDVWASWCVPCKQELPMLDDLAARLRSKGVEILAVSIDEERVNVEKFLGTRPRWSLTVAHDPNGVIADRLQPEKMPTSYMVDRQGFVRYVNLGFVPSDARVIEQRLLNLASAGGVGPRK